MLESYLNKTFRIYILMIFIFCFFCMNAWSMSFPPQVFYGKAFLNDKQIFPSDNICITTQIGEMAVGDYCIGANSRYKEYYKLIIPIDDENDNMAKNGDTIRIYIDGIEVKESPITISSGQINKIDLHAQVDFIGKNNNKIDIFAHVLREGILIEWETFAEKHTKSFNIFRSLTKNGNYVKINNDPIFSRGSISSGASYQWLDKNMKKLPFYFYKIEEIYSGGNTFYGPIRANILPFNLPEFTKINHFPSIPLRP